MRFSICNETYGAWPFERVCDDIAAVGYQGVEIAPFTLAPDPEQLDERRATEFGEIARRAGLSVCGLHWLLAKPEGLHLTTPDADLRERTVAFMQHLARMCAALGGEVMVLGSPRQRDVLVGQAYDDVFARAAEACRSVCEVAGPLGVTLALEPLTRDDTNFLTSAAEVERLIRAVDDESCRLLLDVRAMTAEYDSIPEIIAAHHEHLAHFHANDPNLRGPGTGDVDFVPIARALADVGYSGWVSIEVFDHAPDGPTVARESLAYLERCWARITKRS